MFLDYAQPSLKDDYPKWKDPSSQQRDISFAAQIELDRTRDAGLYQFVTTQLSLDKAEDYKAEDSLRLSISVVHRPDTSEPAASVEAMDRRYTDLNAQEVINRLRLSGGVLFHSSTEVGATFIGQGSRATAGYISGVAAQHAPVIDTMKKEVNRGLAKLSRSQQAQLETLLGRLKTKYKVGFSIPALSFDYIPYAIALGEAKFEVPLADWGSGTINRTLVLFALFQARQISEAETSISKVTPIIVVEEPESFLHPAAQAEFGRVLRDLSQEFQVQVIVTTHSPYLLNLEDSASNILLQRRTERGKSRESQLVDTSGDRWMEPFGQALGLNAEAFVPWKRMVLSPSSSLLLVEGETDHEYLRMLQDPKHGQNQLSSEWEIESYDGIGSLQNTVLLGFVIRRYGRCFVTLDLDSATKVEKTLKSLQLVKGQHYLLIGHDRAGKRNIEGLLPDCVTRKVHSENTELLQEAVNGTEDERRKAKRELKRLLLAEFRQQAEPGEAYFAGFYALAKQINKALPPSPRVSRKVRAGHVSA